MARPVQDVDFLTKQLIIFLSGFQEDDENFDLSYQFVMSNFKHHRFLDVDSHKVTRMVKGIREKFVVHCQDAKAAILEQLCDQFLHCLAFESMERTHTDTHYAILNLLLLLSHSPTNATYQQPTPDKFPGVKEDFDWASYLLEGEDIAPRHYLDSPLGSDDEEDEYTVVTQPPPPCEVIDTCETTKNDSDTAEMSAHLVADEKTTADMEDWLRRNVVVQYWRGKCESRLNSACRFSNIAVDWQSYLMRQNVLYVPSSKTTVTEYQISREVIWMLCGVKELFIFDWNGTQFAVNSHIRVTHLTDEALNMLLSRIVDYGVTVQKLRQFVTVVMATDTASSIVSSRTYEAFAAALSCYLQTLARHLTELELKIGKQDEPWSLSLLLDQLSPYMTQLSVLDQLYTRSIEACTDVPSASYKASHLLEEMFTILTDLGSLGKDQHQLMLMMLTLWLKTVRPYVDIIDNWVTCGCLTDPCQEFFVLRDESVKTTDENFWAEAYYLNCSGTVSNPDKEASAETGKCKPSFLRTMLKDVVLAGKSMELLMTLGQRVDILRAIRKESLYKSFVDNVCNMFTASDNAANDNSLSSSDGDSSQLLADAETLLRHSAVHDVVLARYFEQLVTGSTAVRVPIDTLDRRLSGAVFESLRPLSEMLMSCLHRPLTVYCRVVNTHLLHILSRDYCLLDCFTAIRHFYLMEAGNVMFEFYAALFDRMSHHEPWQDISFLNSILHDALESQNRTDIDRLFVCVDANKTKPSLTTPALSVLNCISLQYQVSWPASIVVSSRCMDVYNEAFCFLLQIKRVKYSLDGLKFLDLDKSIQRGAVSESSQQTIAAGLISSMNSPPSSPSCTHRMHVFRMRLLHFVNSLHDYIMTRILQSVGVQLQTSLSVAHDLDAVITAHREYVAAIRDRCLLHPKVAFIREIICRVLNMALTFCDLWVGHADRQPSLEAVSDVEVEFTHCIQFLSSMIKKVTSRGTFPHLELLAFSLVTCSQVAQMCRQ